MEYFGIFKLLCQSVCYRWFRLVSSLPGTSLHPHCLRKAAAGCLVLASRAPLFFLVAAAFQVLPFLRNSLALPFAPTPMWKYLGQNFVFYCLLSSSTIEVSCGFSESVAHGFWEY